MKPLEKAIQKAGGQTALAELIGRSPQRINNWLRRGGKVPAEECPDIERATGISCEELRPDLSAKWAYLRGTSKKDAA